MATLNDCRRLARSRLPPETLFALFTVHLFRRVFPADHGMECAESSRSTQLFLQYHASHHCTASRSQSLMLHSQSSITHSRFPALEMWHSSSARIGKKTHYITFFLGGPALWWCWYGAMTSGIDSISLIDNCIRTQIWLEDELQRYSRPISLVSLGHKYPSVS